MGKKIRRILSLALTMCVLLSCVAVGSFTTNVSAGTSISGIDYGLMDSVQYGNILHCWNWSYRNIRLNMQKIADQGFSAIQTSPLQQLKDSMNESWSTVAGQWWTPYQPVGFHLENSGKGFGSADEFKAMCHEAHQYGIKVIVDVVFNHMSNDYGHAGTISPNVPDEFRNNMDLWHQPLNYSISNWDDRYDVTHHSLLNLPDLNTGHGTVQWHAGNYLKELISYGADGFRFDAAKHIETPNDHDGTRSEFWYNVISTATSYAQSSRGFTPYYYGEVLGGAGGGLGIDAYTYYMAVTDSEASKNIRNGVLNGNSGQAAQSYTGNGAAADRTVLWNESHDEYIGDSDYTRTIDSWHMNKVWGLVGTRNQNAGLYLARPDNTGQRIGVASLTAWNSWEVQAINQFKNRFAGQGEYISAYGSFAYNVRGNSGAAIVNTGQGNSSAWVSVPSNGMANGTYKDQISGNTFTVSDGWLYGQMGSSGIAMVYNKGPAASVHPSTTAYRSDTYTVTLYCADADHGRYSFNNYDYYDFYNGQQITIGKDKKVGETTVIYYQAVNMWGEYSNLECSYYWKLAPDTEQRVYINNANYGFGDIYVYFYHKYSDAVAKAWPGYKVSYDDNNDMPYVDVPKGYEGARIIVTDNYTRQLPQSGYDGYKLNGETVIVDNDFVWNYYPPKTEGLSGDVYLKTDTWGLDGAKIKGYVWTGGSSAMVSFESLGNNIYKATLPDGVWKHINFLRVNGSASDDDVWNNVWSESKHMIPTGSNMYTMYEYAWDGSGTWGVYDEATGDATVSLVGDFNDWSLSANKMSAGSGNTVTSTINLKEGTYKFKLVQSGWWYGNGGTIVDTTTETSEDGWSMSTSEAECTLQASGGDYTFTYDKSTRKLIITFVPTPTTAPPSSGTVSEIALAGDFNGWDSSATMMKYTGKAYEVSATVEISKGTNQFKIVDEGLWYGSNSTISDTTSNLQLDFVLGNTTLKSTGGTYTFIYNTKTKKLTTTFIEAPTPDVGTISNICMSGDFNGWSTTSDLMKYSGEETVSTTMTLTKGMYYFKVVDKDLGLWYGNAGTIKDTTTVTSNVGWEMSAVAPECVLNASGGDYTFTYNFKKNLLEVTYVPGKGPSIGDVSTASIAGDFNGWDFNVNKMKYTSDTEVSTTMTIPKGTYQFKVVDAGLWYGNSGTISDTASGWKMEMTAGNCTLQASGGDYTFKYNMSTGELTVTFVAAPGPEVGDISTASIAGDFNGWDYTADKLVHTSESVASKTIKLEKGVYYFKVVNEGLWYGNNGTIENTTTTTSSVGWEMTISQGECILNASGGDYTFKFDLGKKMLVVEYTPAAVTVGSKSDIALSGSFNGWSTTAEKMTYASSKTVKTTVKLTAGSYEFKVVDGLWYGSTKTISDKTTDLALSGTAGNVILQASGGNYTFVYDFIDHKLTITYEKTAGPEIGSKSDMVVSGDFNGWSTTDMMTYATETTVTKSIELSKGKYSFKVANMATGLWYGNTGTIKDTTTATSSVGWAMDPTASECILDASGGTYTFTYNLTTNMLTVTYVAKEEVKPEIGSTSAISIAGDFNEWNPSANMLKYKTEDVVTTTLEIKRGTYAFKMVDTAVGLWYGNGGSVADTTDTTSSVGWEFSTTAGDCALVATGGKYTFDYNIKTNMLIVKAEIDTSNQDPVASSVVIAGDFNEWDTSTDALVYETGNIVTITKKLSAGTYGFKLIDNGSWYGNDGTIEDTTTTTSSVGWEMKTGTGNCTLKATGGTYTFRYNTATHMLIIKHN